MNIFNCIGKSKAPDTGYYIGYGHRIQNFKNIRIQLLHSHSCYFTTKIHAFVILSINYITLKK